MKSGHARCAIRSERRKNFDSLVGQRWTNQRRILPIWRIGGWSIWCWLLGFSTRSNRPYDLPSPIWKTWRTCGRSFTNFFYVENGLKVHQLKAGLPTCKKWEDSVMVYYGRLKLMWDELVNYEPLPECRCGGSKLLNA